jgi:hypothetical protein
MYRHFAFFKKGAYSREWEGQVPEQDIPDSLIGESRQQALNAWATEISHPQQGEIGLDVTHFGYPFGDFCWMTFDEVDRRLEWRIMHRYIQIDRSTWKIDANNESPRPVRSTPDKLVIDITGTVLEPYYGSLFGQLVKRDGGWHLASVQPDFSLPEAALDLAIYVPSQEEAYAYACYND